MRMIRFLPCRRGLVSALDLERLGTSSLTKGASPAVLKENECDVGFDWRRISALRSCRLVAVVLWISLLMIAFDQGAAKTVKSLANSFSLVSSSSLSGAREVLHRADPSIEFEDVEVLTDETLRDTCLLFLGSRPVTEKGGRPLSTTEQEALLRATRNGMTVVIHAPHSYREVADSYLEVYGIQTSGPTQGESVNGWPISSSLNSSIIDGPRGTVAYLEQRYTSHLKVFDSSVASVTELARTVHGSTVLLAKVGNGHVLAIGNGLMISDGRLGLLGSPRNDAKTLLANAMLVAKRTESNESLNSSEPGSGDSSAWADGLPVLVASREGPFSLYSDDSLSGVRASIREVYPNAKFVELSNLNDASLENVVLLFLPSHRDSRPLSESEQLAVRSAVRRGLVCVVHAPHSHGAIANSFIEGFGLRTVGPVLGQGILSLKLSDSIDNPIVNGSHGRVISLEQRYTAHFEVFDSQLGSATTLARTEHGAAVVLVSLGSGYVVALANGLMITDVAYKNLGLFGRQGNDAGRLIKNCVAAGVLNRRPVDNLVGADLPSELPPTPVKPSILPIHQPDGIGGRAQASIKADPIDGFISKSSGYRTHAVSENVSSDARVLLQHGYTSLLPNNGRDGHSGHMRQIRDPNQILTRKYYGGVTKSNLDEYPAEFGAVEVDPGFAEGLVETVVNIIKTIWDFFFGSDESKYTDADGRNYYADRPQHRLGSENGDVIATGFRDDTVQSGAGDDFVATNAGDDTVRLGPGSDIAFLGEGNDLVYSGIGGDDQLFGQEGDDTYIWPSADLGNDRLSDYSTIGSLKFDGLKLENIRYTRFEDDLVFSLSAEFLAEHPEVLQGSIIFEDFFHPKDRSNRHGWSLQTLDHRLNLGEHVSNPLMESACLAIEVYDPNLSRPFGLSLDSRYSDDGVFSGDEGSYVEAYRRDAYVNHLPVKNNPKGGIEASVFEDAGRSVSIVVRGTDGASDLSSDLCDGLPQWSEMRPSIESYLDQVVGEGGQVLNITGHSLGGGLGQFIAYLASQRYPQLVVNLTMFSSPGFMNGVMTAFDDFDQNVMDRVNVLSVVAEHDLVPKYGEFPANTNLFEVPGLWSHRAEPLKDYFTSNGLPGTVKVDPSKLSGFESLSLVQILDRLRKNRVPHILRGDRAREAIEDRQLIESLDPYFCSLSRLSVEDFVTLHLAIPNKFHSSLVHSSQESFDRVVSVSQLLRLLDVHVALVEEGKTSVVVESTQTGEIISSVLSQGFNQPFEQDVEITMRQLKLGKFEGTKKQRNAFRKSAGILLTALRSIREIERQVSEGVDGVIPSKTLTLSERTRQFLADPQAVVEWVESRSKVELGTNEDNREEVQPVGPDRSLLYARIQSANENAVNWQEELADRITVLDKDLESLRSQLNAKNQEIDEIRKPSKADLKRLRKRIRERAQLQHSIWMLEGNGRKPKKLAKAIIALQELNEKLKNFGPIFEVARKLDVSIRRSQMLDSLIAKLNAERHHYSVEKTRAETVISVLSGLLDKVKKGKVVELSDVPGFQLVEWPETSSYKAIEELSRLLEVTEIKHHMEKVDSKLGSLEYESEILQAEVDKITDEIENLSKRLQAEYLKAGFTKKQLDKIRALELLSNELLILEGLRLSLLNKQETYAALGKGTKRIDQKIVEVEKRIGKKTEEIDKKKAAVELVYQEKASVGELIETLHAEILDLQMNSEPLARHLELLAEIDWVVTQRSALRSLEKQIKSGRRLYFEDLLAVIDTNSLEEEEELEDEESLEKDTRGLSFALILGTDLVPDHVSESEDQLQIGFSHLKETVLMITDLASEAKVRLNESNEVLDLVKTELDQIEKSRDVNGQLVRLDQEVGEAEWLRDSLKVSLDSQYAEVLGVEGEKKQAESAHIDAVKAYRECDNATRNAFNVYKKLRDSIPSLENHCKTLKAGSRKRKNCNQNLIERKSERNAAKQEWERLKNKRDSLEAKKRALKKGLDQILANLKKARNALTKTEKAWKDAVRTVDRKKKALESVQRELLGVRELIGKIDGLLHDVRMVLESERHRASEREIRFQGAEKQLGFLEEMKEGANLGLKKFRSDLFNPMTDSHKGTLAKLARVEQRHARLLARFEELKKAFSLTLRNLRCCTPVLPTAEAEIESASIQLRVIPSTDGGGVLVWVTSDLLHEQGFFQLELWASSQLTDRGWKRIADRRIDSLELVQGTVFMIPYDGKNSTEFFKAHLVRSVPEPAIRSY